MASRTRHLLGAGENERFADHIVGTDFRSWGVVGYFYSALHVIDAHLADSDIHPTRHNKRDTCMIKDSKLNDLYEAYRYLKDESMAARYDLYQHDNRQIVRLKECLQTIKSALASS